MLKKLITTSWDDGHPQDMKLAGLLHKYNMPATFYIPQTNAEQEVMDVASMMELSKEFEIGGHTIHHVRIRDRSESLFAEEIKGCYNWLGDILGSEPVSFCFPGGVYNSPAVEYTLKTGFKVIRTTELLTARTPGNNSVVGTTLQVFNHSDFTYIKHLVKRKKLNSLAVFLKIGYNNGLEQMADNYIEKILAEGGCFHLWGHSWEIEEFGLWNQLEDLLKRISGIAEADYITNAQLTNYP